MFRRLFVVRHRAFAREFQLPMHNYVDKEFRREQYFVREILLFGIVRVYSKTVFKEHVPNWAWIQEGTQGFTDWKSEAPKALWELCTKKESSGAQPVQN